MIYEIRMETMVTVTVPIEADTRAQAEQGAMHDSVLPRYLVDVAPADGMPSNTSVSLDNKGWQLLDDGDEADG